MEGEEAIVEGGSWTATLMLYALLYGTEGRRERWPCDAQNDGDQEWNAQRWRERSLDNGLTRWGVSYSYSIPPTPAGAVPDN